MQRLLQSERKNIQRRCSGQCKIRAELQVIDSEVVVAVVVSVEAPKSSTRYVYVSRYNSLYAWCLLTRMVRAVSILTSITTVLIATSIAQRLCADLGLARLSFPTK